MPRKKNRIIHHKRDELDRIPVDFLDGDIEAVSDLIKSYAEDYKNKYDKKYDSIEMEYDEDYKFCYYEGDVPERYFKIIGIKDCEETDEEYEKRCGYAPPNKK